MTNEILFYIGVGITVCSLVAGTMCSIFFKVKWRQLNNQFDVEFGTLSEEKGRKGQKRAAKG